MKKYWGSEEFKKKLPPSLTEHAELVFDYQSQLAVLTTISFFFPCENVNEWNPSWQLLVNNECFTDAFGDMSVTLFWEQEQD